MKGPFGKLLALLQPRDRLKAGLLLILMSVNALGQTAGVASIMPFLSVLGNPELVRTNEWLQWAYAALEFQDVRSFLFFLGFAAFIVLVGSACLQLATQWCITRFAHMQQYAISRRLMADYLRRPYHFFLVRNSSDLAKTVLQETQQAVGGAIMPACRLVSQGMVAIALITLLLTMDPLLSIVVAISLAAVYGLIYAIARNWLQRTGELRVQANRERFTAAGDAFAGAKEIRLLGREHIYLDRYAHPARAFAWHQANADILQQVPRYSIEAVAFGGVIALVLYLMGRGEGLAHVLPLLGLFAMAGKQLIPAFQTLFSAFSAIRFNLPAVDNILDDFNADQDSCPLPQHNVSVEPLVPREDIQLDGVSYCYPGTDTPALRDLDLVIPARTTVGLVGPSGAGKSTVVDILLGLLQPAEGEIRVDGVPIDPSNLRHWQAAIGYVPQQIFLSDESVTANIALGIPEDEIDHDAVERAARMANLHNFVVTNLDHGYDTIIGDRGIRLSGGQRQRVGIARALYRDPPVLVLDEATSALDNTTEQLVMEAVRNLSTQKTIILIAHRLTTVQHAHKIFVLDQGCKVEEGDWDTLTTTGSHFRKLVAAGD